ncbi:MAG: polyprenyl synthetase family protein [Candidatus Omnitrophica bacterium]|nr:polyprenyl synthetase family protein [Candidatus Omnitrophota bacterium]
MKAAPVTLDEIYSPVEKELKQFSDLLKEELRSEDKLFGDIHEHLLRMSGKFLRPALTLLCSKIKNKNHAGSEVIRLAVSIELIHTATLVHDDVIDDSTFRRNQPSIYSKWGREISIVSGDYLYAKSFVLLAGLKNPWVNQAFAQCAQVICEGEMKQIEKRNDFSMSEKEYFKIIYQKTAALFQAACAGGTTFSGASREVVESLGNYGFNLGMAFQIVDDCLDILGSTESIGKTAGLDLYKNDVTLPMLYLFQSLGDAEKKAFLGTNGKREAYGMDRIRQMALDAKAIDRAMEKAREFTDSSLESLKTVNDSIVKESLSQLSYFNLDRGR